MRDCWRPRERIIIIGAGLAGCEAAWQLAKRGVDVLLYEMKPQRFSPAHKSADLAELVCSNSFRGSGLSNAVGLLKEEMRRMGSLIVDAADQTQVPAGRALAVDRKAFSQYVMDRIASEPRIVIRREEVRKLPEEFPAVLATGPLTSEELAGDLRRLIGGEDLYFYDAISPVVHGDSIDLNIAFCASRYEDGPGDYLNLSLDRFQYEAFVEALVQADAVPFHEFEEEKYFEGCLPIEIMARRGKQTLAFGPMKPVGLEDPRTGRRPYAVVQLRHEDRSGALYNLVGFQTKLRIIEQQRIFRALPGLGAAEFARYGAVHRNTYVNAPRCLTPHLELRAREGMYLAGQLAGVEGYVESAAIGLLVGINIAFALHGKRAPVPPSTTAHGAMVRFLMESNPEHFQPMNVNYGLFEPLEVTGRVSKRERNEQRALRALADLEDFRAEVEGSLT